MDVRSVRENRGEDASRSSTEIAGRTQEAIAGEAHDAIPPESVKGKRLDVRGECGVRRRGPVPFLLQQDQKVNEAGSALQQSALNGELRKR